MKIIIITIALISSVNAQPLLRNNIAFSGGFGREINPGCCQSDTAVSLGVSYGYRVLRNLQIEAGVVTGLSPSPEIRGAHFDIKPDDRLIWAPFGLRGILPIHHDRIELSIAAGGLYEKYSV